MVKYKPKPGALPINVEERVYEMLNDVYPEIDIAGMTFLPGDVLIKLEPVGFNCLVRDEYCYMLDEGYIEINDNLYHNDDVEPYEIDLTKGD
jgi:hypothetical protein